MIHIMNCDLLHNVEQLKRRKRKIQRLECNIRTRKNVETEVVPYKMQNYSLESPLKNPVTSLNIVVATEGPPGLF
jgi:hypothetical protein